MNPNELLDLLNHGGVDELVALPGIGPALAERIIGARPFSSLEAAQAVKGLGRAQIKKIVDSRASRPDDQKPAVSQTGLDALAALDIEDIRDTLAEKGKAAQKVIGEGLSDLGENLREGVSELGETISKGSQAAYKAVEALPERFEQASKERGPLWTIMVSCAFTAFVAIVLCLIILAGINGSLKFATGAQYRAMLGEISKLSEQVDTMQQDIEGLRGRVNTLEGLGERTVALEENQQQVSLDAEKAVQEVAAMQTQVAALKNIVDQQEARSQRFDTFLKELQTLLGKLFTAQGATE